MLRSGGVSALDRKPLYHKPILGFFSFEWKCAPMLSGKFAKTRRTDPNQCVSSGAQYVHCLVPKGRCQRWSARQVRFLALRIHIPCFEGKALHSGAEFVRISGQQLDWARAAMGATGSARPVRKEQITIQRTVVDPRGIESFEMLSQAGPK